MVLRGNVMILYFYKQNSLVQKQSWYKNFSTEVYNRYLDEFKLLYDQSFHDAILSVGALPVYKKYLEVECLCGIEFKSDEDATFFLLKWS